MNPVPYAPVRSLRRHRAALIALLIGAITVALVVTTALTAQAATLFADDFEDGNANGWITTNGSWSVVTDGSKVYRQSGSSSDARAIANFTGPGSGPFTFLSARVKPTVNSYGNRAAALLTRVRDANTYYYVALRSNVLELGRRLNGTTTILATTPYTTTSNSWHTVSLNTFFTDRVTGSVSGPSGSASVTVLGAPGPEFGQKVGFWTRGTSASFDDIKLIDDRIVPTASGSSTPTRSVPPSQSPTVPPTTPPTSPPTNASCEAIYTVPVHFLSGFQGAITVRNTGTVATNSWQLKWTFADGQVITQLFGGTYRQIGPDVTVDSVVWNAGIPPGGTISSTGFLATWNNVTNSIPVVTCLTT